MGRIALLLTVAVFLGVACSHRDSRGTSALSQDGETYLAVVDDKGGTVDRSRLTEESGHTMSVKQVASFLGTTPLSAVER